MTPPAKTDAEKVAKEAASEATTATDEETPEYPHDELISNAPGWIGHSSAEVAGALSAVPKKLLTIDAAKAATEKWLKAEVS